MYLFYDKGYFFFYVLGRVLCFSWYLSDNIFVIGVFDSIVRLYNVILGMYLFMLLIIKLFIWGIFLEDCSDNMDRFDGCFIFFSVFNFVGYCILRIIVDEF